MQIPSCLDSICAFTVLTLWVQMPLVIAGKVETVGWSLPFALSAKCKCVGALVVPYRYLPFFGYALFMKIVLSVVVIIVFSVRSRLYGEKLSRVEG